MSYPEPEDDPKLWKCLLDALLVAITLAGIVLMSFGFMEWVKELLN